MSRRSLTALTLVFALSAAACGGSAGNGSGSATTDEIRSDGDHVISPTETDRPFDLTGGATSSTEGVTVVDGDPRADLDDRTRDATELWDTEWSRRTVDPGEFVVGIPAVDPRDRIRPIDTPRFEPIAGEAVVGALAGTQLEIISTAIVSYGEAREAFPQALSLSQDTGFGVNYGVNPYPSYSSSAQPFLFDEEPDPRFPALSRVVGVSVGATDRAYPFEVVTEERAVNDVVADTPVVVLWGGDTADALDSASIAAGDAIGTAVAYDRRVDGRTLTFSAAGEDRFTDEETSSTWNLLGQALDGPLQGEQLDIVDHRNEFWFAWASFFPEGEVYSPT